MSRNVKSKFINVRVDEAFEVEILAYCKSQPEITTGDLVRWAIREYMWAHPRKDYSVPKTEAVEESTTLPA